MASWRLYMVDWSCSPGVLLVLLPADKLRSSVSLSLLDDDRDGLKTKQRFPVTGQ